MKQIIIPKGKHNGKPVQVGIHFGKKDMTWRVNFTESCLYPFDDPDDYDINKLVGISFLRMTKFAAPHHSDSIRFGWRCSENHPGKISIYPYWYNKGQRYWYNKSHTGQQHAILDINREYVFRLQLMPEHGRFRLTIYQGAYEWSNDHPLFSFETHFDFPKFKWGYMLFPYFGGDNTAPQDCKIWMDRLK